MPRLYSSAEVVAVTHVTQRCLDYWATRGLIAPSTPRAKNGSKRRGRGSGRLYTFDEILKIKVVAQLRTTGLSVEKIQKGLKSLRNRSMKSEPLREVLVTDGKRFERCRADGQIEDLLRGGQFVFAAVALQRIESDMHSAVIKLKIPQEEFARRNRASI